MRAANEVNREQAKGGSGERYGPLRTTSHPELTTSASDDSDPLVTPCTIQCRPRDALVGAQLTEPQSLPSLA